MSNQYSKTPSRQPAPHGDRAEQLRERIGKLSVKVLRGSEQSLLTPGLIYILVNVLHSRLRDGDEPGRPADLFGIEIRLVGTHAEPGGTRTVSSADRRTACCRSTIAQGM
jgi:hypothetical protein